MDKYEEAAGNLEVSSARIMLVYPGLSAAQLQAGVVQEYRLEALVNLESSKTMSVQVVCSFLDVRLFCGALFLYGFPGITDKFYRQHTDALYWLMTRYKKGYLFYGFLVLDSQARVVTWLKSIGWRVSKKFKNPNTSNTIVLISNLDLYG